MTAPDEDDPVREADEPIEGTDPLYGEPEDPDPTYGQPGDDPLPG